MFARVVNKGLIKDMTATIKARNSGVISKFIPPFHHHYTTGRNRHRKRCEMDDKEKIKDLELRVQSLKRSINLLSIAVFLIVLFNFINRLMK